MLATPRYGSATSAQGLVVKMENNKDEVPSSTNDIKDKFACAEGHVGGVTAATCTNGVLTVQQNCALGGFKEMCSHKPLFLVCIPGEVSELFSSMNSSMQAARCHLMLQMLKLWGE